MTKLIDDELEEDELFWNQEALKDVSKIHIFKKKKKRRVKLYQTKLVSFNGDFTYNYNQVACDHHVKLNWYHSIVILRITIIRSHDLSSGMVR